MREIDPEQCVSRHVRRCALFRIFAQWKREKTCVSQCACGMNTFVTLFRWALLIRLRNEVHFYVNQPREQP